MAIEFHRRLAIPLWVIALFTVAFTAQPATPFLMPPATLFVMALLGIAVIIFTRPGARVAATIAAGTCVRTLDEPKRTTADDALDLVRMDDNGGWQMTRPPA